MPAKTLNKSKKSRKWHGALLMTTVLVVVMMLISITIFWSIYELRTVSGVPGDHTHTSAQADTKDGNHHHSDDTVILPNVHQPLFPIPVDDTHTTSAGDTANTHVVRHSLLPMSVYRLLNMKAVMPKLVEYPTLESRIGSELGPSEGNDKTMGDDVTIGRHSHLSTQCDRTELKKLNESPTNIQFLKVFSYIFEKEFGGLPWWLDEGGLIGAAREGSMISADDDFDFFALLPNQTAPCSPYHTICSDAYVHGAKGADYEHISSETYGKEHNIDKKGPSPNTKHDDGGRAYNSFIHKFLLVFWDKYDLCINKFNADVNKFKSKGRLMYTFQLNRSSTLTRLKRSRQSPNCFVNDMPIAHMHLGMLVPNSISGEIATNIWAGGHHPMDRIPLSIVLPVSRCRAGALDAPCPHNVTAYLLMRNNAEYAGGHDGNCLLMRKRWSMDRRKETLKRTRNLHACGYVSLNPMADVFESSGYRKC